tara:strand:+ start:173 stop:412 length:240 start_codon:yes stop_codon:yes gene_type:complete
MTKAKLKKVCAGQYECTTNRKGYDIQVDVTGDGRGFHYSIYVNGSYASGDGADGWLLRDIKHSLDINIDYAIEEYQYNR